MNRQVFNYIIRPSVVRADQESTVIIHPLGENVAFMQGAEYTVTIRAVDTYCADYNANPDVVHKCVPNAAGDLEITHFFEGEQKHMFIITRPECDLSSPHRAINFRTKYGENVTAHMGVFSLKEDLYGLRCYKGEVHSHTYESDGIQDACHTVGNYRTAAYDFLAITDHYITFAAEKAMRVFQDMPVEMTLLYGEEVHVPTERIHAVHLGGSESVNAYFREHKEEAKAEVEAIKTTLSLPADVNLDTYAWQKWIADKSRAFGGLSILAHPHWVWWNVYFMAEEVTKQLLRDNVYDALDLRDTEIDTSVTLWADMRAEGLRIPVVGSTDSHMTNAGQPQVPASGGYTLVFAPDRSKESLMEAIRADRCLCVCNQYDPNLVFGPGRLVKYAKFLLEFYFPVRMYLCQGEGALLSEYPVEGEPDVTLVQTLAVLDKRAQAFADEFYGY